MRIPVNMRSKGVYHRKNTRDDAKLFVEVVLDNFSSLLENYIENSSVTVFNPEISEFFR